MFVIPAHCMLSIRPRTDHAGHQKTIPLNMEKAVEKKEVKYAATPSKLITVERQ